MASKYWIKLYHEILDDPKMGRLSDRLFRRTIEFFLLAGDYDQDGYLPSLDDIKWRLRCESMIELTSDMDDLQEISILSKDENGWFVTKFSDRQSPVSVAERVARYRDRKHKEEYYGTQSEQDSNEDVTKRYTDTDTDTDTEEEGEETTGVVVARIAKKYESEIGHISPMISELIKDWAGNYPGGWPEEAIEIAAQNNKRKASYVTGILKNWITDGKGSKNGTKPGEPAGYAGIQAWLESEGEI